MTGDIEVGTNADGEVVMRVPLTPTQYAEVTLPVPHALQIAMALGQAAARVLGSQGVPIFGARQN